MNPSPKSPHTPTIILSFLLIVLAQFGFVGQLSAGDWPQILGPQRNGQAIGEAPLATMWDKTTPMEIWRVPVQSGYAGAVIVGDQGFLFDRDPTHERLTAVDLMSGQQRWQATWRATYVSSMDPDSGPRAVPTATGDSVLCYGAAGDLVCVNRRDGKIKWQRSLRKELRAEDGYFGAGSSPLVVDEVAIVNVGGKQGGIVGVSTSSGKILWQATDYDASYASPIAVIVQGKPMALVVTRLRTVLIEPSNGKVLSEIDFGARGPTVNAATPLPLGSNRFLLTASYGIGAHLIRINGGKLGRVWKKPSLLASQYNSPVLIDDTVVGVDGREDLGEVVLKGLSVDQGGALDEVWQHPLSGPNHLIAIGKQLLQLSIDGEVTLSTLTGQKLQRQATFSLGPSDQGRGVFRALPALANHILIVRRTLGATQGEFIAYQLP